MKNMIRWNSIFLYILFVSLISGCDKKIEEEIEPFVVDGIDIGSDRLRGFNLLGKFDASWSNSGYVEDDFMMIQDLGFNFVRLPVDYRTYTVSGDWYSYLENELMEIDEVIAWGSFYNIHVNLNLHRAPGYCINTSVVLPTNQDLDLWTDEEAQNAFIQHWEMFAKRYKDVPPSVLSFNLVNEPTYDNESDYVSLCERVITAIHKHNPKRVIHIECSNATHEPLQDFTGMPTIVQALHNYSPGGLTHYKASWVTGSDSWPVPTWPVYNISEGLYGSSKPDLKGPFTVNGSFTENTMVTIQIRQVSIRADFKISLDDSEILSHLFVPADGQGEWEQVVSTQWGYQNIYNRDYSVTLPADGEKIDFYIDEGDWLTFNKITIASATDTVEIQPGNTSWGVKPTAIKITSSGEIQSADGSSIVLGSPLLDDWSAFSKTSNTNIFVGECGVHNETPHDVTLRYMEDMLKIMEENDLGYALWNLRGSFGIMDSGRDDVDYESFNGHQLDREYLDLLLKY